MSVDDRSSARARQGARDLLVKALYQWQVGGHSADELLEQHSQDPGFGRIDKRYFRELLSSIVTDPARLDTLITTFADRDAATVDEISRAILLLGLEEFGSRPDVPTKVIINEAVELAKRYGSPDCFKFVNAVLDKAARVMDRKDHAGTGD